MIKDSFVIRTTISSQLMKWTLLKGFCIAFLGIAGLLAGSIFFSLPTLQIWGLSLFLISLGLITFGLVPYRRLSRLQLKPNEFILTDDSNQMIFYSKGKKILTIPLPSIARLSYIQHPSFYGIAVWFKPAPLFPVIVHHNHQMVETLRQKGQDIGADLFFPYFNQRAYDELVDWQDHEDHHAH